MNFTLFSASSGCTGKAGVAFQPVGHLVQHGLEAVQLILIQCAGQLGDALLVELVQTIVQLVSAVVQLACTLVQGVHAIVQGLGTGGKLCAAVLGRVCAVCSGLHTGGVLAHDGNEVLDLERLSFRARTSAIS